VKERTVLVQELKCEKILSGEEDEAERKWTCTQVWSKIPQWFSILDATPMG
jgi:hypothetical protein